MGFWPDIHQPFAVGPTGPLLCLGPTPGNGGADGDFDNKDSVLSTRCALRVDPSLIHPTPPEMVVLTGWRGGAPQCVLPGSPCRPGGKWSCWRVGEEVPRSTCFRGRRVGPEEIPEEVALAGWREVVLQRVLPVWSRG